MNTICHSIRNNIPAFLFGELSNAERESTKQHLAACPGCSQELEQYQALLGQLSAVEDVDVPRHFYVTNIKPCHAWWTWLSPATLSWKMAAVAISLAVVVALVISQTRIEAGNGRIAVSFGAAPKAPAVTPQELAAVQKQWQLAMEKQLAEQRQDYLQLVRQIIDESSRKLSRRQRETMQVTLTTLEQRLAKRADSEAIRQQAKMNQTAEELYAVLQAERQQDIRQINATLAEIVRQGNLKSRQTDAILETLVQVAELRWNNDSGGKSLPK